MGGRKIHCFPVDLDTAAAVLFNVSSRLWALDRGVWPTSFQCWEQQESSDSGNRLVWLCWGSIARLEAFVKDCEGINDCGWRQYCHFQSLPQIYSSNRFLAFVSCWFQRGKRADITLSHPAVISQPVFTDSYIDNEITTATFPGTMGFLFVSRDLN